jgi:hypothetical protein
MKLLFLNVVAVTFLGGPLLALELIGDKVPWIKRNQEGLRVIVWLIIMPIGYFWFWPKLGLEINQRWLR